MPSTKAPPPDFTAELLQQIIAIGVPGLWSREHRFARPRRWRADLAESRTKLLVEVEGGQWINGRHNRGSTFEADMEKYNTAALLGYAVLRFSPAMVRDGRALAIIERAIAARTIEGAA